MNTTFTKFLVPAAMLGALIAPVAASAAPIHHHTINSRLHHENHRIYEGVRHGSLTPHEAYRLEHREAHLRAQEYHMRRTGGHLSPWERARLRREENHTSHAIYRQKHDWQHR